MFTGEIDISFFEDKEMTKHIQQAPYQYMSDLEFFFNASDNKSVFMKVKCPDSSATYQIVVEGRKIGQAIEIT